VTITIELPEEVEAQLRESVARQDAEGVRRLLAAAVTPTVEALLRQPPAELSDADFETVADQLAEELSAYRGPNAPALSDEAISREGIYADHP
jgi:antitoxin ParD1/3/4